MNTHTRNPQGLTLSGALDKALDMETRKSDYAIKPQGLTMLTDESFVIEQQFDGMGLNFAGSDQAQLVSVSTTASNMSDHAFKQLCARLGVTAWGKGNSKGLPANFIRTQDGDIQAAIINRAVDKFEGKDWLVRTYQDQTPDGGLTAPYVRALLSSDYTVLDNAPVLQAFVDIMEADGYPSDFKLVAPVLNENYMRIGSIWQDTSTAAPSDHSIEHNYGVGVVIEHDEIGKGSLRVAPYLWRHYCTNGYQVPMVGGQVARIIHKGDTVAKMVTLKSAILECIDASASAINQVMAAEAQKLPNINDVLAGLKLANPTVINDDVFQHALVGTEGKQSVMGVAHGLSAAAHNTPDLPADRVAELEQLAGQVMFAPASTFNKYLQLAAQQSELEAVTVSW